MNSYTPPSRSERHALPATTIARGRYRRQRREPAGDAGRSGGAAATHEAGGRHCVSQAGMRSAGMGRAMA